MNITFLTKYTSKGASSRYRYFLYLNCFMQRDINLEIDSFFSTHYIDSLYQGKRSIYRVFISYIKRFFVLLNSARFLVIEYEVFPYIPYFIESFLLRKRQYVLNIDDNVWDNYKNTPLLKNKFDQLVTNADGVIVANDFLFNKVSKLNTNIIKIPTALDTSLYSGSNQYKKFEKFSLVWIGTKITYKYIQSHAALFKKMATLLDYQLVIVASKGLKKYSIDGVNMVFYDWSSKIESEILAKSHIGIMPLDNDDFSKGKSSFKIIQYMSAGLPVIASSIGENNVVIQDGVNGFLVDDETSWIASIRNLYNNDDLYRNFSNMSLALSGNYSIDQHVDQYYDFLKSSFMINEHK